MVDPAGCDDGKDDSKVLKEVRQPFPCKVYDMLEDADKRGFDHIVSWDADGSGFMVHNKDLFTNQIIPLYFNQTKYKSFQRQLSLYGFQRITGGKTKGLRYHDKLRRGCRSLCREMKPVGYKPRNVDQRDKVSKQPKDDKNAPASPPTPAKKTVESSEQRAAKKAEAGAEQHRQQQEHQQQEKQQREEQQRQKQKKQQQQQQQLQHQEQQQQQRRQEQQRQEQQSQQQQQKKKQSGLPVASAVPEVPAVPAEQSTLPAVVSSSSLYREERPAEIVPVSPELSPIIVNSGAISFQSSEDMVFFEGMPFYLMSAATTEVPQQIESAPVQVPASDAAIQTLPLLPPPASACVSQHIFVDGQMKKAWEIGFAVAMAMNQSSFSSVLEATAVDALDIHNVNIHA